MTAPSVIESGSSTTRQRLNLIHVWSVPPVGKKVMLSGMGDFNGEWTVVDVRGNHVEVERKLSSQDYVVAIE